MHATLRLLRIVALLITPIAISSCASSTPVVSGDLPPPVLNPIAEQLDLKLFQVGDSLELFVKEDATLNGSYPVRDEGYIVIPRAGRIPVKGMSRIEAENKVKEALQKTQLASATVLVERTSKATLQSNLSGMAVGTPKVMLYVTGAVPKPGTHFVPVPNGRTLGLYEALLITGGLGKFAQDQRVEVMRADASGRRHTCIVDLRRVRQGAAVDPPMSEGDVINVPEKIFGF